MNKKRLSFSAVFHNDKVVLLFSVLASITIWLIVTFSASSTDNATLSGVEVNINTATPALESLGLDVVEGQGTKIDVVINCKRYQKRLITKDDIKVIASLTNVTKPDEYWLELSATKSAGTLYDFDIVSVVPSKIRVVFDRVVSATFPVTAKSVGASASSGLTVESAALADSDNNMVTIEGPESEIQQIDKVVALAEVNRILSKTENFDAEIVLYDKNDKVIDHSKMKLTFSTAQVTVPIMKRKEVPIVATFTNVPAAYEKNSISYSLSVDKITVSGPPDIIDAMSSMALSPIDFGSITPTNYKFNCDLNPPAAVKTFDTSITQVRVTVNHTNLSSKKLDVSSFSFVGTPSGKTARAVTKLTNVTIAGVKTSVSALKASDVYAELDLSGITSTGEYEVVAKIKFKKYNNVWAVNNTGGEHTVLVRIS